MQFQSANLEDLVLPFFDNFDVVKNFFTSTIYNEGLPVENQLIGLAGYTPETLPFADLFREKGHRFHVFKKTPRGNSVPDIYDAYMDGMRFIIINYDKFHFTPSSEVVRLYVSPEKFTYEIASFVSSYRWVSMDDVLANIKRNRRIDLVPHFMKEVQEIIADFTKPDNFRQKLIQATGGQDIDKTNKLLEFMSYSEGLDTRRQKFAIYGFTKSQLICGFIFDVMGCELVPVTKEQSKNREWLYTHGYRLCIIADPNKLPHYHSHYDVNYAYVNPREFDMQVASLTVSIRWMSLDEIVKNLVKNNRHDILDGPNGIRAHIDEIGRLMDEKKKKK